MKLTIQIGDITTCKVEAIVNAANSTLLGGGGVDGAIHRKGGPQILEDCRAIRAKQGKCATGNAVITRAGNLASNFVIHTVGPVWNGGKKQEVKKLTACYHNSLQLAVDHGIKTIAFPNISTGIYKFPKTLTAETALAAINAFNHLEAIDEVRIVCFEKENYEIYKELTNKE